MAEALEALSTDELINAHKKLSEPSTEELIRLHQETISGGKQRYPIGSSKSEAAQMGAISGALWGADDELAAIGMTAQDIVKGTQKPKSLSDVVKIYKQHQIENQETKDILREEHPFAYTGSELAGGLATGYGAAIKGANALEKGIQVGKIAGVGGIIGAANSRADLTSGDKEEYKEFAKDVGEGMVIAPLFSAVTSKIAEGVSGLKGYLKSLSETKAVKAAVGRGVEAQRKIRGVSREDPDSIFRADARESKVAQDILNEKELTGKVVFDKQKGEFVAEEQPILGRFSKTEDLAPKFQNARQKYGEEIGKIVDVIDKEVPKAFDPSKIAARIEQLEAQIYPAGEGAALKAYLKDQAEILNNLGKISLRDAQDKLRPMYKFNPRSSSAGLNNKKITNLINGYIKDEMENVVENVYNTTTSLPLERLLGKHLRESYVEAKGKYASFKTLSGLAHNRRNLDVGNRQISPSDYAVGVGAGASRAAAKGALDAGSVGLGIAGSLGHNFVRSRGAAFASRAADDLVKLMDTASAKAVYQALLPVLQKAENGDAAATLTLQFVREKNPEMYEYFKSQEAMKRRYSPQK